jgi:hypothetical protein
MAPSKITVIIKIPCENIFAGIYTLEITSTNKVLARIFSPGTVLQQLFPGEPRGTYLLHVYQLGVFFSSN